MKAAALYIAACGAADCRSVKIADYAMQNWKARCTVGVPAQLPEEAESADVDARQKLAETAGNSSLAFEAEDSRICVLLVCDTRWAVVHWTLADW